MTVVDLFFVAGVLLVASLVVATCSFMTNESRSTRRRWERDVADRRHYRDGARQ